MISLRNPARTRQDNERLARGLGGSAVVHVLLFLIWFAAPPPATPKLDALRTYPTPLVLVDVQLTDAAPAFSDIPGPAQAAEGGADSEGGPAGDPPQTADAPERVTAPPTAPVRAPRDDVRPDGRPTPEPVPPRETPPRRSTARAQSPQAQRAPRSNNSNATRPAGIGSGAGTGQADGSGSGRGDGGGSGSGAGSGTGSGSGGTAPVEVGFAFGNRSWTCPDPPGSMVPGSVTLTVTFRPDGSLVSASGRGSNADLTQMARSAANRCRAQRLPANATQTNQSTQVRFNFIAG